VRLDQGSLVPIYIQIAEGIEDDILSGLLAEHDQAYSQNHIAARFRINPATAAKGLNLLVDEGVLYPRRGMGMYVAEEAVKVIIKKRREKFRDDLLAMVLREAGKLGISRDDIKNMLDEVGEVDDNGGDTGN
jgi:DNA-binding transcriptional regulator YhcF (GntR family)